MTIDTSLIRLDEAVKNDKSLTAEMKVILPSGEEAEIYGFIALDDNMLCNDIDMPPLGECNVLSNRIIFMLNNALHTFPIFSSISKPNQERYNLYLLYIPKFFLLSYESHRGYYKYTFKNQKPHSNVSKLDGVKIEDNQAYYYPTDDDLYFESKSKLRAIGSAFDVVTRRVSKLTDSFKYEIFDAHSVMIDQKTPPIAPAPNPFHIE